MITPELKQYVSEARASGMSDAKIKESLLSLGWDTRDVDGALGPAVEAPQIVQMPTQTPENIATPSRQVFNPMGQASTNMAVEKSHTGLIVFFVLIFLLIAGGLVAFFYYKDVLFFEKEVVAPPISEDLFGIQDLPISEDVSTTSQDTILEQEDIFIDDKFLITPPGPICADVPQRLVAWYPGDGNANDITSDNNGMIKGELKGLATFVSGKVGQAFSFDGYDDYIQASSTMANDPTTAGSLGAWVKFNKTPSSVSRIMQIIGKGGDGTDFDLQADQYNKFRFYVGAGKNVSSNTIIEAGKWYYVVGAWDSKIGLKMYIDGVLENSNETLTTRKPSGQKLEIGAQPVFGGRYFDGLIDEVEIYNRALTSAEILSIFQAGSVGKCKTSLGTITP